MQIEERKQIVATFDKEELALIEKCFSYCLHRCKKHNKFMPTQRAIDELNNLRKDIREFLSI